MKKSLVFAVSVLFICNIAMPENKSALLISNGNYKNFSSLATPVGEAEALGKALSDLGFQVILLKNGTREQMLEALDTFGASFKGKGGTAFFHYDGHGVQVSGKNYLIPADADIPDERKLATRAVDIEEVMITLDSSGSETNIIVLDACRNNPLPAGAGRSASRGLSVVSVKPKNSVIIYLAEAGSVAQDGFFTPALSAAIIKPGISITEVLQTVRQEVYQKSNGAQIPGEYSQLFKQVYLNDSLSHDFSNAKVALDKSFLSRLGEAVLEVPMGGYWEVVADKYNGGSSKASFDEAYLKMIFVF